MRMPDPVAPSAERGQYAVVADEWEVWAKPQRFEGQLDRLWEEIHNALAADPSDDDSATSPPRRLNR